MQAPEIFHARARQLARPEYHRMVFAGLPGRSEHNAPGAGRTRGVDAVRLAQGGQIREIASRLLRRNTRKYLLSTVMTLCFGCSSLMKCRLRQDWFTGEKRLGDVLAQLKSPRVVCIRSIRKSDQKTRIGDPLHDVEKPFLFERSLGPFTIPASRMNDRVFAPALASSS
jgi:hypothetical protein